MTKALDIALKDLRSAFRSAAAWVFMFGVPLMVTGLFYLMFGDIAEEGNFDLPRTRVALANLDQHAPRLRMGSDNVPGGVRADTLSELVVNVLAGEDLSDLIEIVPAADSAAARRLVDSGEAGVALIIPQGFSAQFADPYGQSSLEFYQDPTLTLGPAVVESILDQFMNGLSGIKIAVTVALDQPQAFDPARIGVLVARLLESSPAQEDDLSASLLDVRRPGEGASATLPDENPLLAIVGPIMAGMMIFYAFYTGATSGESILQEEEQRTLKRLFTTPTPQSVILTGKFLSVFLTVLVQVFTLLVAGRLIFGIEWGDPAAVLLVLVGLVTAAASFGVFINSLRRTTKQGGAIFGGLLTITGMVGIVRIFAMGSPNAARLGSSVSLLVPQGWAVQGLLGAMDGLPLVQILPTVLVLLVWGAVFFIIGVWRFRSRYA